MKSIIKPIIIIILIVVAGILGYTLLGGQKLSSPEASDTLTSIITGEPQAPTATLSEQTSEDIGQQFVALLLSIQSINLDPTLFSDPAFISLQDFSSPINQPGNEGRPNPFAPIGGQQVVIQNSPTTTTGPISTSGTE